MCLSLDDKKHKLNHLDFLYLTTIFKKRMCQHDTIVLHKLHEKKEIGFKTEPKNKIAYCYKHKFITLVTKDT